MKESAEWLEQLTQRDEHDFKDEIVMLRYLATLLPSAARLAAPRESDLISRQLAIDTCRAVEAKWAMVHSVAPSAAHECAEAIGRLVAAPCRQEDSGYTCTATMGHDGPHTLVGKRTK